MPKGVPHSRGNKRPAARKDWTIPARRRAKKQYRRKYTDEELGQKRRERGKEMQAQEKEQNATFRKAFLRWLRSVPASEHARLLREASTTGLTNAAKKSLFVELYRHMWPHKQKALAESGTSLHWLKKQLSKDPDFASDVLAIELQRVDRLKEFSYEQSFKPTNEKERMFWLRKIDAEEFGDEPDVNITSVVQNAAERSESFTHVENLIKRRQELKARLDGDTEDREGEKGGDRQQRDDS